VHATHPIAAAEANADMVASKGTSSAAAAAAAAGLPQNTGGRSARSMIAIGLAEP
jgi:hypothetical protein